MKPLRTILVACAFCVGPTACGDAAGFVAPEAPRYDGGTYTVGSGGRADATIQTDTSTAVPSSPETTADGTTSAQGVFTAGSGG
jgi:hypothetical protein